VEAGRRRIGPKGGPLTATIAAVKDTNLEVDLDTEEGIIIASWHNVSKVFAIGDFVAVMSGPSQGTMGWVQGIKEKILNFTLPHLVRADS
jgi:hypothetical protein